MIVFQRMVTFDKGPPPDVIPWAMEITEAVNERTEFRASLWQTVFGRPIGTLVWSTVIDSLTAIEASFDALGGDAAYLDLVSKARDWVSQPGEDQMVRVAHVAGGDFVRPDIGAYAEVTTAVPAEGRLIQATTWGTEIADRHSSLTHSSVLFGSLGYGTFGTLGWMAMYDSAAAVDAAADAISKDEDYATSLDRAGDLFTPGTAERGLGRRIA